MVNNRSYLYNAHDYFKCGFQTITPHPYSRSIYFIPQIYSSKISTLILTKIRLPYVYNNIIILLLVARSLNIFKIPINITLMWNFLKSIFLHRAWKLDTLSTVYSARVCQNDGVISVSGGYYCWPQRKGDRSWLFPLSAATHINVRSFWKTVAE